MGTPSTIAQGRKLTRSSCGERGIRNLLKPNTRNRADVGSDPAHQRVTHLPIRRSIRRTPPAILVGLEGRWMSSRGSGGGGSTKAIKGRSHSPRGEKRCCGKGRSCWPRWSQRAHEPTMTGAMAAVPGEGDKLVKRWGANGQTRIEESTWNKQVRGGCLLFGSLREIGYELSVAPKRYSLDLQKNRGPQSARSVVWRLALTLGARSGMTGPGRTAPLRSGGTVMTILDWRDLQAKPEARTAKQSGETNLGTTDTNKESHAWGSGRRIDGRSAVRRMMEGGQASRMRRGSITSEVRKRLCAS